MQSLSVDTARRKLVVRRRTGFGPDGGVRTRVQDSRGDIIPAFDLEEFHGTMTIQSAMWFKVNLDALLVAVVHHPIQALFKIAFTKD